ncbi:hypothetical protein Tco_1322699 [Tanacetum coccineum]
MSSSGALSTPSYSAGHSTPPSYSSGPSTPPSYSSGPSTPTNYSLGSSRNRECSNCKHLRGKISVLKATMEMHMHPEQHTVNSAALFHEVLNEMEKLDLENMGFNESEEYKKTFIGSGVGTGSVQVLQGVEFEVKPQEDHAFEVKPLRNVGQGAGPHKVQTQDLIYYH